MTVRARSAGPLAEPCAWRHWASEGRVGHVGPGFERLLVARHQHRARPAQRGQLDIQPHLRRLRADGGQVLEHARPLRVTPPELGARGCAATTRRKSSMPSAITTPSKPGASGAAPAARRGSTSVAARLAGMGGCSGQQPNLSSAWPGAISPLTSNVRRSIHQSLPAPAPDGVKADLAQPVAQRELHRQRVVDLAAIHPAAAAQHPVQRREDGLPMPEFMRQKIEPR